MPDIDDSKENPQMEDLLMKAASMPQYDVPEALTQRILSSVADEQRAQFPIHQLVFMAVVVAGVCVFATVDSIETVTGMLSWLVGLGGIIALKLVLDASDTHGKAVKH